MNSVATTINTGVSGQFSWGCTLPYRAGFGHNVYAKEIAWYK
jgi:hypothetical protein